MTPVEIAYIVVAVAIVALVIVIGWFLYKTSKAIEKVTEILENSNSKMQRLDPLFQAIANVGEGLEYRSAAFKENVRCQCSMQKKSPFERYMRLGVIAARIWQDLQTRR